MLGSYAQLITTEELIAIETQQYGKTKSGRQWNKVAKLIKPEVTVDKDNYLVYSRIVSLDDPKKDYFELVKLFVSDKFSGPNCDIKVVDKEMGSIIVEGFIGGVITPGEFAWDFNISLKPIIKIDFKKDRVRITCSNLYYYLTKGTHFGPFRSIHEDKQCYIIKNFPYEENYNAHDESLISSSWCCSKAFVLQHIASQKILDYFEELIKVGTYKVDNDW